MREGWTYKTIEDACSINYGTRVVQKKDKGSTYYVYGGGGATFMIDRYNREDCFIISRFAMSPKCTRYVEGKFFLNDSGLSVSTNDEGLLCQKFLDKVLLANNNNIYAMGKGMAQRNLDMPSFRNLIIPIPPIGEQERIVAELDLLQGIIEKKKEQLKAYDQLAQSIFYSMFGDPIDNPKGWETKPMKDVCKEIGDGLHGTPQYDTDGNIAFINGNNLINGRITITEKTQFVNEIEAEKIYIELDSNTILLSINGTLGKTAIYNNERIVLGKSACYLRLFSRLNKLFVLALMNTTMFKDFLENNSSKSTIKNVGLKAIRNFKIIIPPLELQNLFAEKIEAIERQKALVQQSIDETQTMFDCTMDKYFG